MWPVIRRPARLDSQQLLPLLLVFLLLLFDLKMKVTILILYFQIFKITCRFVEADNIFIHSIQRLHHKAFTLLIRFFLLAHIRIANKSRLCVCMSTAATTLHVRNFVRRAVVLDNKITVANIKTL